MEEERADTLRAISAFGSTIDMVVSFKYLGRVLLAADDDWLAVIQNLTKAWSF